MSGCSTRNMNCAFRRFYFSQPQTNLCGCGCRCALKLRENYKVNRRNRKDIKQPIGYSYELPGAAWTSCVATTMPHTSARCARMLFDLTRREVEICFGSPQANPGRTFRLDGVPQFAAFEASLPKEIVLSDFFGN